MPQSTEQDKYDANLNYIPSFLQVEQMQSQLYCLGGSEFPEHSLVFVQGLQVLPQCELHPQLFPSSSEAPTFVYQPSSKPEKQDFRIFKAREFCSGQTTAGLAHRPMNQFVLRMLFLFFV